MTRVAHMSSPGGRSPFAASPTLATDLPPVAIQSSWERCQSFGLHSHDRPQFDSLPTTDLRLAHEQNRDLMQHAVPHMETLRQQIAETESMVVLTDAAGLIIHAVGDAGIMHRAASVALRPGVSWSEQQKGTNAVGTAIFEQAPTVVHANQHFLSANHFLTCSAAPIFAPAGDLVGVLDVSGDHRGFHKHTLGLVRMSAQMIENTLFRRTYLGQVIVAFHARPEFIGTLMEGLIAFAEDGRVLSANRSACLQLEASRKALTTHTALSLLGHSASELIAHAAKTTSEVPLECALPSGVRVFAFVSHIGRRRFPAFEAAFEHSAVAEAAAVADVSGDDPDQRAQRPQPVAARPESSDKDYPLATLDNLDSGDAHVHSVVTRLRRVADSAVSIMLEGETGAGKEWFARAIHRASSRRAQPFIAVNCASIPEGLVESELFGYEDGAFTGARRKGHRGKILQAHGGTLFLDEIGDMPLAMQARLLRVLQERVVTPLGSSKSLPVDVRLICATHHKLRDLIAAKTFRDDLYYRLNGLSVRLPALRERTDLQEIITRMLKSVGGSQWKLANDLWPLMLRHRWPGNLRQLSNLLSTAVTMVEQGTVVRVEHLPDDFHDDVMGAPATAMAMATARAPELPPAGMEPRRESTAARDGDIAQPIAAPTLSNASLEAQARAAIERALQRNRGNVSAAARDLGISRNTLYRRLGNPKEVAYATAQ